MISKKYIKVLKLITKKFKEAKITWVLIGSANLALQGVDVICKDLDILTTKKGSYKINEVLKKYEIEPVKSSENDKFKSYYGVFKIDGIEIEIMGELRDKHLGDLWSERRGFFERIYIKLEEIKIPVINLEREFKAYTKMGRKEKADKIKEVLDRK